MTRIEESNGRYLVFSDVDGREKQIADCKTREAADRVITKREQQLTAGPAVSQLGKATYTFACGEPSKSVGGGMPNVVVELTVDDARRMAIVHVVHISTGCASNLPLINHRDGRGATAARMGDEFGVGYEPGVEPIELLRRETTRYGWRIVTADKPWWDGVQMVAPVSDDREPAIVI